jgi:hypothetical protein
MLSCAVDYPVSAFFTLSIQRPAFHLLEIFIVAKATFFPYPVILSTISRIVWEGLRLVTPRAKTVTSNRRRKSNIAPNFIKKDTIIAPNNRKKRIFAKPKITENNLV